MQAFHLKVESLNIALIFHHIIENYFVNKVESTYNLNPNEF
jgi:hypothetical protein